MHANPTITAVKQLPRSGVHTGVISRVRVRQNRPTQCQNHLSQVHGIAICWTMCQGKGRLECSHTQQKLPRYQPTTSCSCAARMSTQQLGQPPTHGGTVCTALDMHLATPPPTRPCCWQQRCCLEYRCRRAGWPETQDHCQLQAISAGCSCRT
jgi:hypothetical protein